MKKRDRDYAQWLMYALVGAGLLLVGLLVKQKLRQRELARSSSVNVYKYIPPAPGAPPPAPRAAKPSTPPGARASAKPAGVAAGPVDPTAEFVVRLKQQSEAAVQGFQATGHLKFPIAREMQFRRLEIEDHMAVIHGRDSASRTELTAMAYGQDATSAQALQFLKSQAEVIPNLKGAAIESMDGGRDLPPPAPGSGLSGGTMWSAHLSNGNDARAVFLRREDQKGTYMFVYTGPPQFFKGNDGAFDSLYGQVQATGP